MGISLTNLVNLDSNNIQIIDENGEVLEFPIISIFNINLNYYVILDIGDEELTVFRVENNGEHEYLQIISDIEEWELICKVWSDICDKMVNDDLIKL